MILYDFYSYSQHDGSTTQLIGAGIARHPIVDHPMEGTIVQQIGTLQRPCSLSPIIFQARIEKDVVAPRGVVVVVIILH